MPDPPHPDWVLDQCRALGNRVRNARNDAELTQEQLAELVGVSWRTIHRIEYGFPGTPVAVLLRLARALKTTLGDLLDP